MKNQMSTIIAFIFASVTLYAWSVWDTYKRDNAPVYEWFAVRTVSVADFEEGDFEAPVVYDRIIRKPFTGKWIAEVVTVPENFAACTGSGENRYEVADTVPPAGVTFSWFIGKNCILAPGQYAMKVHWDVTPLNYPTKEISLTSNVFTVRPKGSLPYVSKEQLNKIEEQP